MNDEQRVLVSSWIDDSKRLMHTHFAIAEKLSNRNKLLNVPAAILSAVAGTAIFVGIGVRSDPALQTLTGAVSLASAVLAALASSLSYSEQAQNHKKCAAEYADIRKELEILVVVSPGNDVEFGKRMNEIRKRWEGIRAGAPAVSAKKMRTYVPKSEDNAIAQQGEQRRPKK